MTRNMLIATATAIVLGLSANHATAHSSAGDGKTPGKTPLARGETHSAAHDRNRLVRHRTMAHRFVRGAPANGAPAFYAAPPNVPVYRWPGYTYVPRKGIVDEACNLPTSACPNELRDIQ